MDGSKKRSKEEAEELDGASDDSSVKADFEFFDPQQQDFEGIKQMLKQLFHVDNDSLDLSGLSDLILSQPLLGSTVKTEDEDDVPVNENDPLAFMTVLNATTHKDNAPMQGLVKYLLDRCSTSSILSPVSTSLRDPSAEVGIILSERFLGMPPHVQPPMYKMLLEEIEWALEDKEAYNFTHYLIVSRTFVNASSAADEETQPLQKKRKQKQAKAAQGEDEVFYVHAELPAFKPHALCQGGFEYKKPFDQRDSDAKRAFHESGILQSGFLVMIEAAKFQEAVAAVEAYVGTIQN